MRIAPRRVLYIGTPFGGYYRHICRAFETLGFEVDYFNDRPSENPLVKGALKLWPSLVTRRVERYLTQIVEGASGRDYELILVVNGKIATPDFVRRLRAANPRAEAVLYLWDAVSLYPHVLELVPEFDRAYSFDSRDCREHPEFTLLPLFHTPEVAAVADSVAATSFDLVNVCTVHENRYLVLRRLLPLLAERGLRVFNHLYLHPLQYAYNVVARPVFREAAPWQFAFTQLPTDAYVEVLRTSKAVLDVNHAAQTGLTIRTMETLGANRRLVTTNEAIVEYDFYEPRAVFLLDVEALDIDGLVAFLDADWSGYEPAVRDKYSVDSFVATLAGQ